MSHADAPDVHPEWCSHIKWMECGMTGWYFDTRQLPFAFPADPNFDIWRYIGNVFSVCPICEKKRPGRVELPEAIGFEPYDKLIDYLASEPWKHQ